jgi:tRNA (guanine-N7-)-methyltransferase
LWVKIITFHYDFLESPSRKCRFMSTSGKPPEQALTLTDTPSPPQRRIKSFVKRSGRMGSGQLRAIAELSPRFVLPYGTHLLDVEQAFGNAQPLILEIGFGMGETTAAIAAARPEHNFLGVEVHEAGVGALLKRIGEQSLSNIRIMEHDAVEVVRDMLARDSLAGVHVFFPDPWHKKRHHKRRLMQAAFVSLLSSRIKPGGYLHFATDWQEYADYCADILSAEPILLNTVSAETRFAPKPEYRPLTKFEARGLRLGHGVWDLVFRKP